MEPFDTTGKEGSRRNRLFAFSLVLLLCLSLGIARRCLALPVWSETADPNGQPVSEDIIGYENDSYAEFKDSNSAPGVIEYHVREEWVFFPHRLNSRSSTPHTLDILFDANAADSRNLLIGVTTDAPSDQYLGVFFDGHAIHRTRGEPVQPGMGIYHTHAFWLGKIEAGGHRISITNETDPNSGYGIFIDYVKLAAAPQNTIRVPAEDHVTIAAGLQNATPGDTILVKTGIYEENSLLLKPGITLRSASAADPNGLDPSGTIIDGGGKNIISGAYQAYIRGFTLRNSGLLPGADQGVGIRASHDFMAIANSIISSCGIGLLVTGQGLDLSNLTLARNDCGVYAQKWDANAAIPSFSCRNTIMSDSNCGIYVFTEAGSAYAIDPNRVDEVITSFSFNDVYCTFPSFSGIGAGNLGADPCFLDPNAGDFRLSSFSPCIDAGDPNDDFSLEPVPNGGRINMGAFGNTGQAQRSLDTDGDGVKDFQEGKGDWDGNGLQDWQDNGIALFPAATGQGDIIISLVADPNAAILLAGVSPLSEDEARGPGFDLPEAHFLWGFWNLRVTGLAQGGSASVRIELPRSFSSVQGYYVFDPGMGWNVLPEIKDENPSQPALILQLTDGDAHDMDGIQDGAMSHRGGIGISMGFNEGFDFSACFIGGLER